MKKNKKATSIAEAMVLMLIVVTWVTWMYKIYMSSVNLERSINNKIIATNIAREWIEVMKNIRNTNWVLYASDTKNCWNTLNYNSSCIWDNSDTSDIGSWSYIINQNSENRWILSWSTSWNYSEPNYRTNFRVWLDSKWFYTQTWVTTNLIPLYTREIQIDYINTTWSTIDSNDEKMKVTSLVQWEDNTSTSVHRLELTDILSNWKK